MEVLMSISIVLASPKDARGIQEVFYDTWLATYPNEELMIRVGDIKDFLKNHLSTESLERRRQQISVNPSPHGRIFLVAKDEERVVGVCNVVTYPTHNQIHSLYVLPEYQRMRIGSDLCYKAFGYFNSLFPTTLWVASYNSKAIRFYESLGFRDTGERKEDETIRFRNGIRMPEMEMVREPRSAL